MTQNPKRIAVAIIRNGDAVVVGRRPEGSVLAGHDEFPGGKCLKGESFEAAAIREAWEETGLAIAVLRERARIAHTYPHGRLEIAFLNCVLTKGCHRDSIRLPFRWVPISTLGALSFPEANQSVVSSLVRESQAEPRFD